MTSREVREECGLEVPPADLKKIGMIDFEFKDDPVILEVHVFTVVNYKGHPVETEGKQNSGHSSIFFDFFFIYFLINLEMLPKWFHIQEIPFQDMWADDKMWFPLFLAGKKFQGYFLFEGHDVILKHTLKEVSSL